tara:strand:- start:10677 stop:11954 length:1278 start_codon:yes stop_codon:yes gene_type:complete
LKKYLFALFLFTFVTNLIPLPLKAQEIELSLEGPISLEQLIPQALERNRKIKAAKKKRESAIEKLPQATSLDDPEIGIDTWNIPSNFDVSETRSTIFWISQKFPFPGKLKLKGNIVSKEVEKAKLHLDMSIRDVIVDLKKSYFELVYIDKAIEITQKIKDLAEHLAKLGATGLSMDGTTLNDVFKAQSQLAQLNYDLVLLTELRVTEATNINAILNIPPESPMGLPNKIEIVPFDYKLENLYKLAEEHQEELKILNIEVEKNREKIKFAKRKYYPDFQVKLRRFQNTNSSLDSGYGAFFGVKVPLWFKKNKARVMEAEKNTSAAAYEKDELKNKTFSKIKQLYFKLQNSARLLKLYKESLIPQAEKSMEIAETWYKEKKGSFSGLLESQSVWLNFNLARERALADYHQRLAELERLTGGHLRIKD